MWSAVQPLGSSISCFSLQITLITSSEKIAFYLSLEFTWIRFFDLSPSGTPKTYIALVRLFATVFPDKFLVFWDLRCISLTELLTLRALVPWYQSVLNMFAASSNILVTSRKTTVDLNPKKLWMKVNVQDNVAETSAEEIVYFIRKGFFFLFAIQRHIWEAHRCHLKWGKGYIPGEERDWAGRQVGSRRVETFTKLAHFSFQIKSGNSW